MAEPSLFHLRARGPPAEHSEPRPVGDCVPLFYTALVENELAKYRAPEIALFAFESAALAPGDPRAESVLNFFGVRSDLLPELKAASLQCILGRRAEREARLGRLLATHQALLEDLKATKVRVECDKRKMVNILLQGQRETDALKQKTRALEIRLAASQAEHLALAGHLARLRAKLDKKQRAIESLQLDRSAQSPELRPRDLAAQRQESHGFQLGQVHLAELANERRALADELTCLFGKSEAVGSDIGRLDAVRAERARQLRQLDQAIGAAHDRLRRLRQTGTLCIPVGDAHESDFHKTIVAIQQLQKEREQTGREDQRLLDELESLVRQRDRNQVTQKRLQAKMDVLEQTVRTVRAKLGELSRSLVLPRNSLVRGSERADFEQPPFTIASRSRSGSVSGKSVSAFRLGRESITGKGPDRMAGSLRRAGQLLARIKAAELRVSSSLGLGAERLTAIAGKLITTSGQLLKSNSRGPLKGWGLASGEVHEAIRKVCKWMGLPTPGPSAVLKLKLKLEKMLKIQGGFLAPNFYSERVLKETCLEPACGSDKTEAKENVRIGKRDRIPSAD